MKSIQRSLVLSCAVVLVGLPGCSAAVDSTEEAVGSRSEALATCAEQPLSVAAITASSEQNGGHFAAAYAVDFRADTRWSSEPVQSTPQWLRLDFGQRKLVSSLSINWEAAYSPSYEIQASDDGVNWAVVRSVTNDKPGVQTVPQLEVTARYLRIFARVLSGYGNISIVELTAFGDNDAACAGTAASCGQTTHLRPTLAQATSSEFSYTPASAAIDDVYNTRWSSAWSDDQSLALDLGSVARIDSVRVTWQAAYAAKYAIETAASLSGPWTVAARNDAGRGGVETLNVGASARYVRLHGIQRATGYGYSVWELDVLGSRDSNCSPNLLTRGWDPTATTNNIGLPSGQSVPGLYSIDPAVLNRIDLSESGQYCPVGGPGYVTFTQHVTVPVSGSKFHLTLDISRDNGSLSFVLANATLAGVQGSAYTPLQEDYIGAPIGHLNGTGQIQADFVTNLVAGQNVNLTLKFPILGANVPNTNCGVMLQSFTLGGATLTRVN